MLLGKGADAVCDEEGSVPILCISVAAKRQKPNRFGRTGKRGSFSPMNLKR
jgi:hypothetical protein